MSVVNPSYQDFFDLPDGVTIGVTRFKLVETNNTIVIAPPLYNAEGTTGCQLLDTNDALITSDFYITANGTYTMDGVSAANIGKEVTFISIHRLSNGNFSVTVS